MTKIYLGLGSNVGDRAAFLAAAIDKLPPEVEVQRQSPIYETEPWGFTDQPDFLNCVVAAETDLAPPALLAYLKQIEAEVGRRATFKHGPREIDIDILLYGDAQIEEEEGLTIPHPRLHERAFVLRPLADLVPELVLPSKGRTVAELLADLDQTGIRLYSLAAAEDKP